MRSNDFIGRWGGEEFVIIFSNVDLNGVRVASEKVRHLIETSKVRTQDRNIQATISIGATISIETDTAESIVKRADNLMYISKINGKNKVSVK